MTYRVLLCVALCACAASSSYPLEEAEALFEKFIVDYKKQYAHEAEKQMRFEIFNETLKEINALNERQEGRQVFAINTFSDYTAEEKRLMRGYRPTFTSNCRTDTDIHEGDAPDSWDWRDKNVVTPVKNQGQCGGCYTFSTTGNIEGQYAIKHGVLLSFSEQQILDCSGAEGNMGCDGGMMANSLEYIIDAGGIEKESDYEYVTMQQACAFDITKAATQVTDCATYNVRSHEQLKQLVYEIGPLSIAIDASTMAYYSGNVFKNCPLNKLDHAVLLVGYGTDPTEGDYWIVKNSWGDTWGESGYVRIERGEGKVACGMLNDDVTSSTVA